MMTALPEPPATGQMINTNVNKHYPTSKYLKHWCQPRNLCLVGDDPIQVKRMSGMWEQFVTSHRPAPGQCSAPSRPTGSPRSWWRCTCPCRRWRHIHIMFRVIDCIVWKRLCVWVVLQLKMLASCYADSLRRRLSVLLLYFMSVCHSFLVCMRDGSPNISYFHRWKSNEIMRWWNDDDETVASPTKVFGVSDHDGDGPV